MCTDTKQQISKTTLAQRRWTVDARKNVNAHLLLTSKQRTTSHPVVSRHLTTHIHQTHTHTEHTFAQTDTKHTCAHRRTHNTRTHKHNTHTHTHSHTISLRQKPHVLVMARSPSSRANCCQITEREHVISRQFSTLVTLRL